MAKKIKRNRFATVIVRDNDRIEVCVDYLVECDQCGEVIQKSHELELTPNQQQEIDGLLERARQVVANIEDAELE